MTSQKPKALRNLLLIIIVAALVGFVISTMPWNLCGIKHFGIIDDIKKYEETLDPEYCDSLVNRILEYNEQCSDNIEILDCG